MPLPACPWAPWRAPLPALVLAFSLGLGGCASPGGAAPGSSPWFNDAAYAAPRQPVDEAEVMAASPAMRDYLDTVIRPELARAGPGADVRRVLLAALARRDGLLLEYESTVTRDAAQAFDARRGNCLSLLLMTAALARELDVPVTFQQVDSDELWSRAGGLYMFNGHVNLVLSRRIIDTVPHRLGEGMPLSVPAREMTVDFIAPEQAGLQRARAIPRDTVLAMFLNNRAAEALVQGDLDEAYWLARAAVARQPGFVPALNTLGVVHLRHGDAALQRESANARVLANLVQASERAGLAEQARSLAQRLARLEPEPPFQALLRGQQAAQRGDDVAARDFFLQELRRSPDSHEAHYWLAVVDARLGRLDEARAELAQAVANSGQQGDRALYGAKLARLDARRREALADPSPH